MEEKQHLCRRCGEEIPPIRMMVLPDTVLCTECSKEVGGDYELITVPGSLGKASSLKHNYGVWDLQKKRRTIRPKEPAVE